MAGAPAPKALTEAEPRQDLAHPSEPIPHQCRTAVEADAACLAIWEERRRRFFGTDRQP
ncbi:putative entry exclusion protein TrbK-alt [Sphingobium yanoikuyae]|uniref:putative entry exclusion protein TrbK-alt n=1 Tax=Sphingobium yanoikuyae TaxID=13690 RepID=UPI0035B24838